MTCFSSTPSTLTPHPLYFSSFLPPERISPLPKYLQPTSQKAPLHLLTFFLSHLFFLCSNENTTSQNNGLQLFPKSSLQVSNSDLSLNSTTWFPTSHQGGDTWLTESLPPAKNGLEKMKRKTSLYGGLHLDSDVLESNPHGEDEDRNRKSLVNSKNQIK